MEVDVVGDPTQPARLVTLCDDDCPIDLHYPIPRHTRANVLQRTDFS